MDKTERIGKGIGICGKCKKPVRAGNIKEICVCPERQADGNWDYDYNKPKTEQQESVEKILEDLIQTVEECLFGTMDKPSKKCLCEQGKKQVEQQLESFYRKKVLDDLDILFEIFTIIPKWIKDSYLKGNSVQQIIKENKEKK